MVGRITTREVSPLRARPQAPEHGVKDVSRILPRATALLGGTSLARRDERFDDRPLLIGPVCHPDRRSQPLDLVDPIHRALRCVLGAPANLLGNGIDGLMFSTRKSWYDRDLIVVVRDERYLVDGSRAGGMITRLRNVIVHSMADFGLGLVTAAEADGLETAQRALARSDGAPWIHVFVVHFIPHVPSELDSPHVVHHLINCREVDLCEGIPLPPHWGARTTRLEWGKKDRSTTR